MFIKTIKKIATWCWATLPRKIISSLVIAGLVLSSLWFLFFKPSPVEAGWWDQDWLYRVKITIDQTKIDADLTNFPVLVKLTSSQITFSRAQSAGQDIRFTDYAGNLLNYEIERWDNGSSLAEVWVKIPNIDDTQATYFYMYYGNASAVDEQDAENVWDSNYKGVWHMHTTSWLDSTLNDNDGTGAGDATTTTSGKINSAGTFDDDGDYIDCSGAPDHSVDNLTVMAWIKPTDVVSAYETVVSDSDYGTNGWRIITEGAILELNLGDGSQNSFTNSTLQAAQWQQVGFTFQRPDVKLYYNGASVVDDTLDADITQSTDDLWIGKAVSTNWYFDGEIDEVRISNTARSAAWIKADYNSGNDSLLTYGSEEKGEGPVLWLKFDEGYGTTAYDSSEQDNDFTLSAASWTTSGKFSRAWDGDGTVYLSRADDADFDFAAADNFSISGWFKHDTISAIDYIVAKHESGTAGGYKVYMDADGDIVFAIDDDGTWGPEDTIGGDLSNNYDDNTWHHFMAVKHGTSQIELFVDGISLATDTSLAASASLANAAIIYIGIDADGSTGPFDGELDEIKIYPYARSLAQIKRDYNQGFAVRMGSSYTLPAGLVAYWNFERGSGTTAYDQSDNSNDGTLYGDTSWTTDGKYGQALDFDGTGDYVDLGTSGGDLVENTNFSVSLWVKPSANLDSLDGLISISQADPYPFAIRKAYPDDGNTLEFMMESNHSLHSTIALSVGVWTHIVVVFDSSVGRKMYFDGTFDVGDAYTTVITATDQILYLGLDYITSNDRFFNGQIDHVMIFDRALTAAEIEGLYTGFDRPGSADATTAHWKFDEGFGTTAEDASGRGNDLTLSAESYTMSGKFGRAWDGDGAKYLSRADDADFDFTAAEDFSISMWFKSDSATNPSSNEFLIDKESSSAGYAIYMDTSGDVVFGIDDDSTWNPDDDVGNVGDDYYDNTWHHVVAVKHGTTSIKLYVDAKELSSDDSIAATGSLANSALLYVGDKDGTDNGDEFNGDIDEVKIYRFALSASDVKVEYNRAKAVQLGGDRSQSDAYCPPGFTGVCTPPVGEWKFDEYSGSTAYDTSANTNNGTITDATWKGAADCKYGSCLDFDGTGDYVDISMSELSNNTWSFSIWLKAPGTITDYFMLMDSGSSANERIKFYIGGTGYVYTTDDYGLYLLSTGSVFSDDWHHITVTYDFTNQNASMYIDGNYDNQDTSFTQALSNVGAFRLAERYGGYAEGQIDHVMIWNRALGQSEISWLYDRGKPVGHWKMDEGEGSTAYDSSENNKPGTVTNATWTSSGKFNSALDFDGTDDYVDVGDTSQTLVKAVSLWVKPDSVSVTEQPLDLNGTGYVQIANGTVTGEGFTSPTIYVNGAIGSTVTTKWNHIVITTGTGINASDLDIGRLNTTYFDGTIDEVKIYNYELSSQQVKLDYNQGSALRFGD